MESLTQLPQGLVLMTGPTGSGKTTTLYAALAHANDVGRKIITIENPVEYQLEGISQIQTHDESGSPSPPGCVRCSATTRMSFSSARFATNPPPRSAIRAAQTGHLVFSTLHTNDSVSAITACWK